MQIRIRIDVSRLFWHISFRTTPDFADVTTFYTYPDVVGEFIQVYERSRKSTVRQISDPPKTFKLSVLWNSPTTSIPNLPHGRSRQHDRSSPRSS